MSEGLRGGGGGRGIAGGQRGFSNEQMERKLRKERLRVRKVVGWIYIG